MGPTSLVVVTGLWVLLAVAIAWVTYRWGASANNNVWSILRRLGSLAVVCALMLTSAAFTVNRKQNFYGSWSDIGMSLGLVRLPDSSEVVTGLQPEAAMAAEVGPMQVSAGTVPVSVAAPTDLTPAAFGGYHVREVSGPASGHKGKVTVLLPPSYNTAPKASYPVLYALHGFPGNADTYFGAMRFDQFLRDAVANKGLAEPIVVFPEWSYRGIDTECTNSTTLKMQDWLGKDVPAWVMQHYRVRSERTSWATVGFSAGAYCSTMLAMKYPSNFAATIGYAGYFRPQFESIPAGQRHDVPNLGDYDLLKMGRTNPPPIALWLLTAHRDELSGNQTRQFVRESKPPMSFTFTDIPAGGHRIEMWYPYIPQSLTWLGKTVPGFKP